MIKCDYCGKTQEEVKLMITGKKGAAICSECVITCMEILVKESKNEYMEIKFSNEQTNE